MESDSGGGELSVLALCVGDINVVNPARQRSRSASSEAKDGSGGETKKKRKRAGSSGSMNSDADSGDLSRRFSRPGYSSKYRGVTWNKGDSKWLRN